jgi:hypothetical protein
MSKRRDPKRIGSLSSLADVLPGVCEGLELDKKIHEMALLALWPKQVALLAGSHAAENSRAVRLKKQGYQTILLVRVAQAALASELGFQVPALKEALNRFTPQTGLTIDHIQLTVGSL